jgi:hypothetical protein
VTVLLHYLYIFTYPCSSVLRRGHMVAVDGWGTMLPVRDHGFEMQWGHWIFPICLILPATVGSGVYSASNRNEYQKLEKKKKFLGSRERPVLSWLSRQFGILNISHPYEPPRPVTGVALLFFTLLFWENCFLSTWHNFPLLSSFIGEPW